jgi:DNA polymerase I-like protein with 3'-5' exonuclease and polymerase domains
MSEKSFLFLGTEADRSYLPYLKPHLKGNKCFVDLKPVSTIAEVELYAKSSVRNITGVISTSTTLLAKLTGKENPSLDSYAGSYFKRAGIEYVFVNPLEQCITVAYGSFLLERFVSKLCNPGRWLRTPDFNWAILKPSTADKEFILFEAQNVIAIAVDIETFKHNLAIRCVGYTAILDTPQGFATRSIVIPLTDEWALQQVRRFNNLPAPKIFQNGKYDNSYLLRYNSAPKNWLWDTATLFHCWYAELPKDLAFLQSFFVREAAYWKDLAETKDLETYYLYNAKDTWATACSFLAWMMEAPQWARDNYQMEFPLNYPCLLSEMTGVKRDPERRSQAIKEIDVMLEQKRASMDKMLGVQGFNPNSTKQVGALFKVLGCGDLPGTGDKEMAKAIYRHPLNRRILGVMRGIPKTDEIDKMGLRAMRKMKSTYLADGTFKNSKGEIIPDKDFKGRGMYSLVPHGTDTGRLASGEHAFWCGANIQNIPVGRIVKQTVVADEGFYLAECDLEQAETRDTAYITGDKNLIAVINGPRDFHSHNVEAFFGLPYDTIYDAKTKKVLNKPIRNTGKRVNHGANYNMGPDVLVDTMGEEAVYEAARLLKLPRQWTAREIAEHFLKGFDKTYPTIRGEYHVWVINQILTTRLLKGATGWTRYCFDNPKKSKPALNAYVAHNPQSLNAMVLNKAYMRVFYDIAISPAHRGNFKLLAQIHDSIFFQYREGHEYLADMVKERMEVPVRIRDIKGIERTFTVPAALKLGKLDKDGSLIRAKYWSETE